MFNFLFMLIFSFSAFGSYVPKSKVDGSPVNASYVNQNKCESVSKEACIKLPRDYNHEYYDIQDQVELVPVFSKNQIDSCSGENDCQEKLESLICEDTEEVPIRTETEVYCTKQTGFKEVPTGGKVVKVNPSKKSVYDNAQQVKENEKQQEKNDILAIKQEILDGNNLNNEQVRKFRLYLLRAVE